MRREATVTAVEPAVQRPNVQPTQADAYRLLDADDIAAYIGMTTDWIYREVRAGRMPHIRLGRYVRFRRESIDAWLKASERGGTIRFTKQSPRRR